MPVTVSTVCHVEQHLISLANYTSCRKASCSALRRRLAASPAASATALAPGPPSRVPASRRQWREQDALTLRRQRSPATRISGWRGARVQDAALLLAGRRHGSAAPSPQCGPLAPSRTWWSVDRDVGAARARPAITAPGPGPGG